MKPSERISEIFKREKDATMSRTSDCLLMCWVRAILLYIDEQAETRKGMR